MLATLMQQYTGDYYASAELGLWFWAAMGFLVLVMAFYVAAMWRIFTKADYPGWHALIPILNTYTLCRVAGRPEWWFLLMFIPCVGQVFAIIVWFDVAKAFGKGSGYGLGLVFLSPIFIPMLAFGRSQYSLSGVSGGYYGVGPGPSGYGAGGGFGSGEFQQAGGFTSAVGAAPQPYSHTPPPSPTPPPLPTLPSLPSAPGSPGASTPSTGATSPAPVSDGPVAGWYPEPAGGPGLRWWDGSAWTDHKSG